MIDPNSRPTLRQRLSELALDGAALAGAGLIAHGADLIYPPAGFIVAGLFLLMGAWIVARGTV